MSKDYLHIFNDLLKELERKKKNPFPKRKSSKKDDDKDTSKDTSKEKNKKDDDEEETPYSKKFKIPKFLRPKKAKGINIDYGTAGSKITEKHKK